MTPIIYGKFALTCINLVRKLSVNVVITIRTISFDFSRMILVPNYFSQENS